MNNGIQIEKEEAVQKALGTLPSYRISIFGPDGLIGTYNKIVDAVMPIRAIYYACLTLGTPTSYHREDFLRFLRDSWENPFNSGGSVYIQLNKPGARGDTIYNLRCILDIDGNIRKDLSKEILDQLKCIQKGKQM